MRRATRPTTPTTDRLTPSPRTPRGSGPEGGARPALHLRRHSPTDFPESTRASRWSCRMVMPWILQRSFLQTSNAIPPSLGVRRCSAEPVCRSRPCLIMLPPATASAHSSMTSPASMPPRSSECSPTGGRPAGRVRLLLDECIPFRLRLDFEQALGAPVDHVVGLGWSGCTDNALMARMVRSGHTTLITTDRSIVHQQPRQRMRISILVLRSRSNRAEDLRPLIMSAVRIARTAPAGRLVMVGP